VTGTCGDGRIRSRQVNVNGDSKTVAMRSEKCEFGLTRISICVGELVQL
jgi:hypothetical protein